MQFQEELGLRGAQVVSHQIDPDFGLAIDTTIAFDLPGSQIMKITSLGSGPAIKIMDASTICDPRMVKYLKQTAVDEGIKWQPEVLTVGGTDTKFTTNWQTWCYSRGCFHSYASFASSYRNVTQGRRS